ncbi:unnamed protein product, partial [Rotaria sordida]
MSANTSAKNNSTIQSKHNANGLVLSCIQVFFERLFARKPMKQLQEELATKQGFKRTLNWIQLLAVGL